MMEIKDFLLKKFFSFNSERVRINCILIFENVKICLKRCVVVTKDLILKGSEIFRMPKEIMEMNYFVR